MTSRSINSENTDTASSSTARAVNRREALTLLGSAVAFIAGCSGESANTASAGGGGTAATGAAGAAAGTGGSGGAAAGAASWAQGGTRVLAAQYPDPFSDPIGSSCSITCQETIGPCYAASVERRD